MPKEGLTNKQQAFVQEYCSNGFNASQAYRIAYPLAKTGHTAHSARLVANGSVKQAIEAKKAEIQAKTDYSRSQAELEYEQVRTLAIGKKDLAAANQAIKGKARLYGLDLDKHVGEDYQGQKPPPAEALATSKAKAEQIRLQNSPKTAQGSAGQEIRPEPIPEDQIN